MPHKPILLKPEERKGTFRWPGLTIRKSEQNDGHAGQGVFATHRLKPGLMIPILGLEISDKRMNQLIVQDCFTHGTVLYDGTCIDARESFGGLTIWARINEPSRRKPNCVFKLDSVVVAKPIKAGEELTLYYGNEYQRPYKLRNQYLHGHYKDLSAIKTWPKAALRRQWRSELQQLFDLM